MATPQEEDELKRLISAITTIGSPQLPQAPPQAPTGLDAPYNAQANMDRSSAGELETQASTPYRQPQTLKEHLIHALGAGAESFGRLGAPGGYYGQEKIRQDRYADEQKTKLDRAKVLRGEAQQQQELGQSVQSRASSQFINEQNLEETRKLRAIQEKEAEARAKAAGKPTLHTTPAGSRTDAFGDDGKPISGSTIEGTPKPPTEKNQGFRDRINAKGETERDYFDQSDPSVVTSTANLGVKRSPENDFQGRVQAQATINGQTVIGTLDKATGVFTPAKMNGQDGYVQGAAEGNSNAKAGSGMTVDLVGAERLYRSMQDTLTRIESGKSSAPGADDMVLLSNHIAMTFGTVKGARTGKDLIEAHLRARSLPDNLAVMYSRLANGEQLTPGQRREFVELASRRVNELKQSRMDFDEYTGANAGGATGVNPSGAPVNPGGGGARPTNAPVNPGGAQQPKRRRIN